MLAHHNEIEPAEEDGNAAGMIFILGKRIDVIFSMHELDEKTGLVKDYAKLRAAIALDKFKELLNGDSEKKDGKSEKPAN